VEGLIDTHCHLADASFENDLDLVINRALIAGVEKIVIPAVDLETSRRVVELSSQYPQLYAAVGVHPEESSAYSDSQLPELLSLAQETKVVAIGEIGLDFHYPPFDKDLQERMFIEMLKLAAKVNKPVLVHSRDSIGVVLRKLETWLQELIADGMSTMAKAPGILHAFEGNLKQASTAINLNFAIGLGGPITYKNSTEKIMIARVTGLDHLVLETDAPYLPPHPYRGQRNEPAHIQEIAGKLAELKQQPIDVISHETGITRKPSTRLEY